MPAYADSPFQPPVLVMKGVAAYLWGSFDPRIGNSNLYLTQIAGSGSAATATVQLMNGPVPVIGGLITIINSTTSAGAFNVRRAVITAVTINAATGAGTIQFASATSVAATADTGTVIVEPAEVSESLVNNTASIACVHQAPGGDSQFTVPIAVTFPVLPTAVTVSLQGAIKNSNAEYTTMTPPVAVVAAGVQTQGPFAQAQLQRGYVYRVLVSGLTGNGSIIVKLG